MCVVFLILSFCLSVSVSVCSMHVPYKNMMSHWYMSHWYMSHQQETKGSEENRWFRVSSVLFRERSRRLLVYTETNWSRSTFYTKIKNGRGSVIKNFITKVFKKCLLSVRPKVVLKIIDNHRGVLKIFVVSKTTNNA